MAERRATPERRGRGKDKAHEAKPFTYAHTPRGWRVKQGDAKANWRHAREVCCSAPTLTMPNGDIVGIGVVQRDGDVIRITA